jgi:hypothetical protein
VAYEVEIVDVTAKPVASGIAKPTAEATPPAARAKG